MHRARFSVHGRPQVSALRLDVCPIPVICRSTRTIDTRSAARNAKPRRLPWRSRPPGSRLLSRARRSSHSVAEGAAAERSDCAILCRMYRRVFRIPTGEYGYPALYLGRIWTDYESTLPTQRQLHAQLFVRFLGHGPRTDSPPMTDHNIGGALVKTDEYRRIRLPTISFRGRCADYEGRQCEAIAMASTAIRTPFGRIYARPSQ
jgi:hypothetical protein